MGGGLDMTVVSTITCGTLDFWIHATAPGSVDAGGQQRLHAFFCNALSPACQAGWINGNSVCR